MRGRENPGGEGKSFLLIDSRNGLMVLYALRCLVAELGDAALDSGQTDASREQRELQPRRLWRQESRRPLWPAPPHVRLAPSAELKLNSS